ncbi:MAG TPA: DNA polymerase III subunit epsilon [Steroidobacteraceae bacterium]|nr:DNA polymerase III subunit epsilon [Steroidobacteraceae bacterium]
MRQIVLDTETTGLEVERQHRIIEIGCVEIFNRRVTGRTYHQYLNPERDIEQGAEAVHGLTRERLSKEPTFGQVHADFLEFIRDAELIIHNAPFDVAFLNLELSRLERTDRITDLCRVLDTLALARQMHPGQRNNLDALCKRYSIDNSHRDFHGALLDARILAEVYLAMTGGQATLVLSAESDGANARARSARRAAGARRIPVIVADADELAAHEHVLLLLDKASQGATVWRRCHG